MYIHIVICANILFFFEKMNSFCIFHKLTCLFSEFYTTKLLQKREMRKDIVIELSYKGFSRASDYS